MRPKFNIPKLDLKISSLRPEAKAWRDQYAQYASGSPDSRPPTPRSVRPPMAHDIEAELRAACTYIVTHPKPSHEVWSQDAARPALDYAAIKAREPAPAPTALPARKPSLRAKVEARLEAVMHESAQTSSKYSYRPNVHTEELFRYEDTTPLPTNARSRADLLMAPEPPRHGNSSTGTRSESHSHSSSQQQVVLPAQVESVVKVRTSARSDSVGTSGSTPQTDSTDYPWSTSTGITSAVNTPARSSKRASSQNVTSESGSVPKVETVNAEWMKQELEKHKKAIELREKEREKLLEEQHNLVRLDKENATMRAASQPQAAMSQVPPRKPVPSRPDSRQARDVSRPGTCQDTRSDQTSQAPKTRGRADSGRTEQSQQTVEQESRGRIPQRSNSRLRNVSRTAKRAVSRAGSITNDILGHYLRPGSETNSQGPTSPSLRQRSPSRTRHIATHVKGYFRPGSATGSRKPSMDATRGGLRSPSTDSFHSATSGRPGSTASHKTWKGWRLQNKSIAQIASEISRPASAASGKKTAESSASKKPPIDLNRELPPLPSLDSWKDEPEAEQPTKSKPVTPASVTGAIAPAYQGLKRALSKRDLWSKPASRPSNQDDIVQARLGVPTPPQSGKQSMDSRRLNLHIPSGTSIPTSPLMSSGAGPSLDEPDLHYLSMANLSTTKSAEPRAKTPSNDPGHSRLRSKSGLTNRPDVAQPRLPRSTSSHFSSAHDSDRPTLVLTGNPNLVYHSRAVAAGLVDDPTRAPSPSMSGKMGHSRTNSDRLGAGRKVSMDDYARYQNAVEIQAKQAADRDRSRKHWWKRQEHKEPSWMDQVIKSGARNGMLVTSNTAGSPVARY